MNKLINWIIDINTKNFMNIKMRAKDSKNLKKKIGLKNLFVQKNKQTFKPKNINIQTISIDKTNKYFNEDKKFFSTKNLNKIRYLNNSSINYNINNANYLQDDEQISLFDSSGSDRVPSPIDSLKSSSYFTNTIKKRKYKRHQNKIKNNVNNLSLNSNINKCNNSIFLCSSSSSDNDYSESDMSCNSRDDKKKVYYDKMMIEENELDYLKRSEVGLISSEEEDNNSVDNSNSIEENFNNEIERILIEIYNKNISIVSSGYYNYNETNKNSSEIEDIEKQIKKYLKKENFKTILLVLKSLSNKIKELVGKYKEKVFEIEDIKNIYDANQLKRQILINNQIIHCNNSIESNVATNSNSNSPCESFNEEENNLLINVEDEIAGKGIANILLRELINIKKTLKISSKEIEGIFKYPLNILKDDNGKKIKFSVELMQCEEFCKTLLNDELISTLLNQIKNISYQIKIPKYIKLIEELEENCTHKNEMTRFFEYINDKLDNIKKNSNNNNDNDLDESNVEENINGEIAENKIEKETDFSLNKSSYNESKETGKKIKKKKNNKNKNNKIENDENNNKEVIFKDIDELLNYINEDSDSKKGKKKGRKSKKNKKQNNSIKDSQQEKKEGNDNSDDNLYDEDFEKEFENFKNDIESNTSHINNINKTKPCLSEDFLEIISKY